MTDVRAQLPRMVLFARVVEERSFSAAARALGLSRSVVSEAVAALEESMGCRLLHRTTRAVRTTELGELFYARCRRIAEEADAGVAELSARLEGPQGTLRLTAPQGLSEELVVPVVAQLRRRTGMEIELVVDDQHRDLVREGFDLSVRMGRPKDSSLTIRRLGRSEEILVAAPEVAGRFQTVEALRGASWVAHTSISRRLTLRDDRGKRRAVEIGTAVRTNSTHALRALTIAGAGVAMMPYFLARPALETRALVRVLPRLRAHSIELFVLMPSRQHVPAGVRMLVDALVERVASLQLAG